MNKLALGLSTSQHRHHSTQEPSSGQRVSKHHSPATKVQGDARLHAGVGIHRARPVVSCPR